jgi:hypothetical protein
MAKSLKAKSGSANADTVGQVASGPKLPGTREELLELHRTTRKRRNAAPHGSEEHRAAIDLIGRIEVEVARIERAMDPPQG